MTLNSVLRRAVGKAAPLACHAKTQFHLMRGTQLRLTAKLVMLGSVLQCFLFTIPFLASQVSRHPGIFAFDIEQSDDVGVVESLHQVDLFPESLLVLDVFS